MTDRSKQTLNIYKGDRLVMSGEIGKTSVEVALPGGTTATDGEYQGTFKDTDGNESTKADFPAFKVPLDTVTVTGVTVDPTTANMKVGDTKVITATVVPTNATNKAITYASSDEKIATIAENGTVTAVAAGTADITATAVDGGSNAKCAVTVVAPVAPVTTSNRNLAVGTETPFTMTGNGSENEIKRMYSTSKPIAKGTTVTVDFDIDSTKAEGNYMVQFANEPWQVISSTPLTTGTQHQSYTITADADYSEGIQLRLDKSTSTVTVSNFIISESSK
ncbi:hypothetical protein GBO92_01070 [Pediococcus pentosaceus]|uniref:Ig-like domain-containing protein n=1 Tax=Pediococcus pentosaceus TaxID=1255 RepID=UPI0013215922|nr:Ig-like domain-containing protein [Pediococcus pentosaceus]KAF0444199.1 hypothetical protein GBO92_01070 [Pediococcus pentosaceus]